MEVFFINEDSEKEIFNSTKHLKLAEKFLLIKQELLIIGSFGVEHKRLFNEARSEFTPNLRLEDIIGAGNIRNGKIIFWGSVGMDIITPNELKPQIIKALHQN